MSLNHCEIALLPLQEWTPFLSSILNPIQTPRLSWSWDSSSNISSLVSWALSSDFFSPALRQVDLVLQVGLLGCKGSQSPYPYYSLFCGQLVAFGQTCNFRDPNLVTFYLCIYLILNEEDFTFHIQYKHSSTFANLKYEELSYPKNQKMINPILVILLKMRPHYSHSCRENVTPSSGTSPLVSYEPPPGLVLLKRLLLVLDFKIKGGFKGRSSRQRPPFFSVKSFVLFFLKSL